VNIDQEATVGRKARRFNEFMMAIGIAALGVQLSLFPEEVFRPHGALGLLIWFAPPLVWTLSFVVFGTARFVIVMINGFWPISPTARWLMSIASLTLWLALTAGYWTALPLTKGFPALVLSPIALSVEGVALYALTVMRWERKHGG
jgi:hypothetical protein